MYPIQFEPLAPEHLHDHWPSLRYALEEVLRKAPSDWIPSDVYAACRFGQAQAVMARRGEKLLGWFVWTRQQKPFSGRPQILLWAAWAIPPQSRNPGDYTEELLPRTIEWLRERAREQGVPEIVAISPRPGMRRLMPRLGFRETYVTYALEA